jgi:hypothetical protein
MPTAIEISVGHRGQRILGNSLEQCLKLVPLAVLINFPTVEIEVRHSTVARDVLQCANKLRYPGNSCPECGDVVISTREVILQEAVSKLNICGVSICVGADVPTERILRAVV